MSECTTLVFDCILFFNRFFVCTRQTCVWFCVYLLSYMFICEGFCLNCALPFWYRTVLDFVSFCFLLSHRSSCVCNLCWGVFVCWFFFVFFFCCFKLQAVCLCVHAIVRSVFLCLILHPLFNFSTFYLEASFNFFAFCL